jgi:hypothetical protein
MRMIDSKNSSVPSKESVSKLHSLEETLESVQAQQGASGDPARSASGGIARNSTAKTS